MKNESQKFIKYKILGALLLGLSFASLLILSLNIAPAVVSVFISIILLPGSGLSILLTKSQEMGHPLAVVAGNSIFYALVAYALLAKYWLTKDTMTVRGQLRWLIALGITSFVLVCIPKFDPLWPRGMDDLAKEEHELQAEFYPGVSLNGARSILQSRKISIREETEASDRVVLERENRKLAALQGDRVLSGRFQTDAQAFPCGYDIEIVLLFGQDDRLKDQYIGRLRICP